MSHTPAPLRHTIASVKALGGYTIATCHHGKNGLTLQEADDNARLYAAAPKLLSALTDLVMLAAQYRGPAMEESIRRAQAVIAQAVRS